MVLGAVLILPPKFSHRLATSSHHPTPTLPPPSSARATIPLTMEPFYFLLAFSPHEETPEELARREARAQREADLCDLRRMATAGQDDDEFAFHFKPSPTRPPS